GSSSAHTRRDSARSKGGCRRKSSYADSGADSRPESRPIGWRARIRSAPSAEPKDSPAEFGSAPKVGYQSVGGSEVRTGVTIIGSSSLAIDDAWKSIRRSPP